MLWELFVFTDHMSRRPERLNNRFNLLCQISVLSCQLDLQMLFQRVYFGAPAHKMSSNI